MLIYSNLLIYYSVTCLNWMPSEQVYLAGICRYLNCMGLYTTIKKWGAMYYEADIDSDPD